MSYELRDQNPRDGLGLMGPDSLVLEIGHGLPRFDVLALLFWFSVLGSLLLALGLMTLAPWFLMFVARSCL